MKKSFMDYVDDKSQPQAELRVIVLFRNVFFFLSFTMVCFIFIVHFSLVANMALGLPHHGHEHLRACMDHPYSIST